MAYLNCPQCPAQGLPDGGLIEVKGVMYQPFRCNGGTHRFYIPEKELNGKQVNPDSE